jgi:BirA family biotin operon repressor/biotin-[acetyl-CoA-carboxylase] ligase
MQKKSNHKLSQLLDVMRDGEFHDGTALGQMLQMTRSAIWKMIKKLDGYGIEITSVKGKGYALCEPITLLNEEQIRSNLHNKQCQLSLFESIDSTNEYLRAMRHPKGVRFCIAEQQTKGRGRLARTWYSPFGKNIYLSCLYPFQKDISELAGLSLVVSLAIMRTLHECGIREKVNVKWPNDIICDAKKISGTLIEVQAESHGLCHAVVGIGLNVNMLLDEKHQISQSWTSMRRYSGLYQDRNKVCASLINHLLDYLQRFDAEGFAIFIDEWVAAEGLYGEQVSLKCANETVIGEAVGINAQGHLLLKLVDGNVRAFSSGDTSIAKKV